MSNGRLILDLAQMDSQSGAFEVSVDTNDLSETATPLRCFHPMKPQPLVPWTPARVVAAATMAIVSAPVLLLQPAINRRRA
jgi:hypothetical protein